MGWQADLLEYQPFERRFAGDGHEGSMGACGLMICAGRRWRRARGEADSAKGQSIANRVCAACHGADGNSPTPAIRNSEPDSGIYRKQLSNFRSVAGKKAERENPSWRNCRGTFHGGHPRRRRVLRLAGPKTGAAKRPETLALVENLARR